jgi:hypothetical protein
MATQMTTIEELDRRLKKVEQQVSILIQLPRDRANESATQEPRDERAIVTEILRNAGLLSEPTEHEKALAAEWRALPEEERKRAFEEFSSAAPDVMLSQIVIDNRR